MGLSLVRGSSNKVEGAPEGVFVEEGMPIGLEALSDDDGEDEQ